MDHDIIPERIVTGHDERGMSRVMIKGKLPQIIELPNGLVGEAWVSGPPPFDNGAVDDDLAANPLQILPHSGGSAFRFFTLMPYDDSFSEEELQRRGAQALEAMGGSSRDQDTSRHAEMHKTDSLDYVMLLKGTATLIMEEVEVELKPFQVVVQRGTNHAWVNRGAETALLAAVVIPNSKLK